MTSAVSPINRFYLDDPRLYTAHPAGAVFFPIERNFDGRTQYSPALVEGQSTAVIVVLGQSNSANHCGGGHTGTSPLNQNFNYVNGGLYRSVDPLLGTTGDYACFANFLADRLIANGRYDRVILATMGINATLATDWAADGIFAQNIRVMCRRLASVGLVPTMILYQQGESDNVEGTTAAVITPAIRSMVSVFREEGVPAPVFIASCSTWPGYSNNAEVRLGQANALSTELGIFAGPDTDTIGPSGRDGGGVHFNATGSDQHAALWEAIIVEHFDL